MHNCCRTDVHIPKLLDQRVYPARRHRTNAWVRCPTYICTWIDGFSHGTASSPKKKLQKSMHWHWCSAQNVTACEFSSDSFWTYSFSILPRDLVNPLCKESLVLSHSHGATQWQWIKTIITHIQKPAGVLHKAGLIWYQRNHQNQAIKELHRRQRALTRQIEQVRLMSNFIESSSVHDRVAAASSKSQEKLPMALFGSGELFLNLPRLRWRAASSMRNGDCMSSLRLASNWPLKADPSWEWCTCQTRTNLI